tara:strand:- start:565 stop:960 length:396 start_codon:yes stop_codon:yes gene_type:complete
VTSIPTILIIEDDPTIADLIQHKLERDGYQTKIATTGDDGLKLVREIAPSVVILDGMLPGMDGLEILRTLKSEEDTKDIAVLMLTARDLEHDVVSGLSLGADDYMTKPFMPNELSVRVKRLLAAKLRLGQN